VRCAVCARCQIKNICAVPCLRPLVARLSLRRPGFEPGSIHTGLVVDKVALGQVYLRVLRFSTEAPCSGISIGRWWPQFSLRKST
jgi:hypothetical protein